MRDTESAPRPGEEFGQLLREARVRQQLRQEDVWSPHTPVARATYRRWESGDVESPTLSDVRAVCLFLGINPARAAIALGLTTLGEVAELFSNGAGDGLDDIIWQIGDILRDPKTPLPQRKALRHAVHGAFGMWQSAVSMTEPQEPSGEELTRARVRVSKRTT
jgi:transcriptional regulator with XRE-family HTH domain